jgi:hypothetical protein
VITVPLTTEGASLTLFDHNTISNGRATVAAATVTEPDGAGGALELTIFDFAFSSSDSLVLWVEIDDVHSQLNYSTVTMDLQDPAYSAVSAGIQNLISQYQTSTIANVKLKGFGA